MKSIKSLRKQLKSLKGLRGKTRLEAIINNGYIRKEIDKLKAENHNNKIKSAKRDLNKYYFQTITKLLGVNDLQQAILKIKKIQSLVSKNKKLRHDNAQQGGHIDDLENRLKQANSNLKAQQSSNDNNTNKLDFGADPMAIQDELNKNNIKRAKQKQQQSHNPQSSDQ